MAFEQWFYSLAVNMCRRFVPENIGNDDNLIHQNLNAMDSRVKDLESRLESFYVPSLSVTGGKKVKKGN